MALSFNSIAQDCATFYSSGDLSAGMPCKLLANGRVLPCSAGEDFCGIVQNARGNLLNVAVRGFITTTYSGTAPSLGRCHMAADGSGGVCLGDAGPEVLVVSRDTTLSTVTFLL